MHLDKELRRLRARRREVQKAKSDEDAASDAMGPSMHAQASEVWERCTASERQLCDCFSLAAAGLRQLATPADLEHRMQRAAQEALAQDALLAEQAAVAAALAAQEAAEAAAAEAAAAAAPAEEAADGEPAAEAGAEGGEEQAEAEASTPFLTAVDTPDIDAEAAAAADAPAAAAAAAAAEAATAAADVATAAAEAAAADVTTLEPAQPPSTELLEVAEGNGPVNALGKCLVKALLPLFPVLEFVELSDYKVRILDNEAATGAVPRVMIEFIDTQTGRRWTTASADSNIITASLNALVDGIEYMLEHRNTFVEREN